MTSLLVSAGILCHAQGVDVYRVHYRVGSRQLDLKYKDNEKTCHDIMTRMEQIERDSTIIIRKIVFSGSSSPEGSDNINRKLALGRRTCIEKLTEGYKDIPSGRIFLDDTHIHWNTLSSCISGSNIEYKDEILDILDDEPLLVPYKGNTVIDRRVLRLQALHGGIPWRQLNAMFFSDMRSAEIAIHTVRLTASVTGKIPSDTLLITSSPAANQLPAQSGAPAYEAKPTHNESSSSAARKSSDRELLLKTNIPGWALMISNIGVELDLTDHLSLSIPVYFGTLDYFTRDIKFRTFTFQPELRYWIRPENEKWFIGAHFGMSYYNIALGGGYRYQDHAGSSPALGGGLSVGYRLPLGKDGRWKMEFGLGGGGYHVRYDTFRNVPSGLMTGTVDKVYWGLDNATVSVAYTFRFKGKGGRK